MLRPYQDYYVRLAVDYTITGQKLYNWLDGSDRLSEFERLVWVGRVDEPSLVNKLATALDSRELREALQDDKEELKFRLRRVFRQLEDPPSPPH